VRLTVSQPTESVTMIDRSDVGGSEGFLPV